MGETDFSVQIVEPKIQKIHSIYSSIRGYLQYPVNFKYFGSAEQLPSVSVNDKPIRMQIEKNEFLPRDQLGFIIYIDLSKLEISSEAKCFEIDFVFHDGTSRRISMEILLNQWQKSRLPHLQKVKKFKRNWILKNLASPGDQSDIKSVSDDRICFKNGTSFDQTKNNAIYLVPTGYGFSGLLEEKEDRVSAHAYSPLMRTMLGKESARVGGDFMALDFGAGLRPTDRRDVINLEIFDYPSTDVICVGQALPFKDNSFDMVCTFAVLEHVDDPFTCAKEMLRVLKPGGLLISGVPFLQPEHGYPAHFYNMTRQGHFNLYQSNLEEIEQFVDAHQHPITSLTWILREYMNGLPKHVRDVALQMSVGDFMRLRYFANPTQDIFDLTEEAKFKVASATTIIGRKKVD